jgi:hypothetical protein
MAKRAAEVELFLLLAQNVEQSELESDNLVERIPSNQDSVPAAATTVVPSLPEVGALAML